MNERTSHHITIHRPFHRNVSHRWLSLLNWLLLLPLTFLEVRLSSSYPHHGTCMKHVQSRFNADKKNAQSTTVYNMNSDHRCKYKFVTKKTLWSTEEILSSYIDINIWTILGLFVAQSRTNVSLLWSFQHGKLGYSKGFLEDVHFPRKLAM